MPVYVVTGKLGGGKTLSMVGRMREYAERGLPVATNINLDVRHLLRRRPKFPIVRLPDRPTAQDLLSLGAVHSTAREELNGALVLDECAAWLNARQWGGEGRQALIEWLLHSRKLGWDVYLIVQSLSALDKQVRDSLAEYVVTCRRLDRVNIPVLGRLVRLLTFGLVSGRLPHVHVASVRYGVGPGGLPSDTWVYRGRDLYAAYQSVQVLGDGVAGPHSLIWYATEAERRRWRPVPKPKLPLVAAAMALPAPERLAALRRWSGAPAAA